MTAIRRYVDNACMETGDRSSDARPWQFGLRDLFVAIVWASILFFIFGGLVSSEDPTWLWVFSGAPSVLLAIVMIGTRHRAWLGASLGFAFTSCFFMILHGAAEEGAAHAILWATLLTGSFGGATLAGVSALVRGYHVIGGLTTALMGLWWPDLLQRLRALIPYPRLVR